jgi:hypothetical protein
MTKRGDLAPRPAGADEWKLVLATSDAATGWDQLCRQAPGPLGVMFDALTVDPRRVSNPHRQGRLKGSLGSCTIKGETLEQWQYEITGAGRVCYATDDVRRTVWITLASPGHPKQTD